MKKLLVLVLLGLPASAADEPIQCAVTVTFPASNPTDLKIKQPNPACKAGDVAMALKVASGLFEQAPPPNQNR